MKIPAATLLALAICGCTPPVRDAEATQEPSGLASAPEDASAVPEDGVVQSTPVTVAELVKAYSDNEAAAQQEYGGKWLAVTGKVSNIDLDFEDKPVLHFDGKSLLSPSARFAKAFEGEAATLKKGQGVTIVCGTVHELMGAPELENCRILSDDMIVGGSGHPARK